MIQRAYLIEWRDQAPWQQEAQIEQDLVLSRALAEIYADDFLKGELAFRGGTALNKVFFPRRVRYSEDIDLVRLNKGGAKPIISALQKVLDPWLGKASVKLVKNRVTLNYRFKSEGEPVTPMKLKVEINTEETKPVYQFLEKDFKVDSGWYSRSVKVRTYELEELLGTKLRALFQRRKGRDLLDLDYCLNEFPNLDVSKVLAAFKEYLNRQGLRVSRAEFEENLFNKMKNETFINDTRSLLAAGFSFDVDMGYRNVSQKLLSQLSGAPWKRPE